MLLSPQHQAPIYQNHMHNEMRYVSPAPMMMPPPPPPAYHYQNVPPSKNIIVTGGMVQQMEQ